MASKADIKRQRLLCVADSFISIFIFAPLVVAFWRGFWQLMDHYLYRDDHEASVFASTLIGIGLGVFFDVFQDTIKRTIRYQKTPKIYLLVSRLYTVVYCITSVNHWRGIWKGWDVYTGISWKSGLASAVMGLILLSILRGVKNLIAPPFTVLPDHFKDYFTIQNLYGTKKSDGKYFYMDIFTSVVVIASLVVFVWRGVWVFLDRVLYPHNELYSGCGSMVIGLTVTGITFLAQLILQHMNVFKSKGFGKIIAEDIYFTLCLIGTLNIWRGVWILLNVLLYPDKPLLSNWISTIVGILSLMTLQNGNTIFVRGTHMDGEIEGADGIKLTNEYLRFFFKSSEVIPLGEDTDFKDIEDKSKSDEINLRSNGLLDTRGFEDSKSLPNRLMI